MRRNTIASDVTVPSGDHPIHFPSTVVPFKGFLLQNELLCPCGKQSCTKWICKKTYADILRSERPDKIFRTYMTHLDAMLGSSTPIVGNIQGVNFRILDILKRNLIPESQDKNITRALMEHIKEENQMSKVGDPTCHKHFVNEEVRNSLSVNLNKDITEQISEFLVLKLEQYLKYTKIKYSEIEMYQNHSTLTLYPVEGTFFHNHRDEILTYPDRADKDISKYQWVQYSMVCCLDSNLNDRLNPNKHDGCTVVYLPPYDVTKFHIPSNLTGFKCIPHVFNESIIPGEFVAFPSGAKHCSKEITQKGGYKFILKADFRIKVLQEKYTHIQNILYHTVSSYDYNKNPIENSFSIDFLRRNTVFKCDCKLCNPFKQRMHSLYRTSLDDKLPLDIINLVMNQYLLLNDDYLNNFSEYYTGVRFKILTYFPRYISNYLESERHDYYDDYNYDSGRYDDDDRFCNGDGDY